MTQYSDGGIVILATKSKEARQGLLYAAGGILATVLLLLWVATQPWGISPYLILLLSMLLLLFFSRLAYRSYALLRLRYQLTRDALVIFWGWSRYTLPLPDIKRVLVGRSETEMPLSPWYKSWHWPALFTGRVMTFKGPLFLFASSPPKQQVLLEVSRGTPCAVTPTDVDAFLAALEERHRLGPNRRLSAGFASPFLWRIPLLHDSVALSLLGGSWLAFFLLLTYLTLRWPVPLWGPNHFAILLISGIVLLSNTLLGILLFVFHRKESYLLWGTALFMSLVSLLALLFGYS